MDPFSPTPSQPSRIAPGRRPPVLVVDDELRSIESIRRTLEDDFTVFVAASADEADAILRREPIEILLCDQRMPGVTGVEFLKRVRAEWPDVVRIIISGYTDAEDIIGGVNDAGIWQYVLKPWRPGAMRLGCDGVGEKGSTWARSAPQATRARAYRTGWGRRQSQRPPGVAAAGPRTLEANHRSLVQCISAFP